MKKVVLFLISCSCCFIANAQDAWKIEGYALNVHMHADTQLREWKLSVDGIEKAFRFKTTNGKYLLSSTDEKAVMEWLQLSEASVHLKYAAMDSQLSAAEKLLLRTTELPGQIMRINGSAQTPAEEVGGIRQTEAGAEEQATFMLRWWWIIIGFGGGAMLGWWVAAKGIHKKPVVVESALEKEEKPTVQSSNKLEKVTALREEIRLVKQSEKALQNKLEKATAELQPMKSEWRAMQLFNEKYYTAAYQKLVLPAEAALEQGNLQKSTALLLQIYAQYASLSRTQLQKRLRFDEENLRQLVEGAPTGSAHPQITATTPEDEIPNTIRQIILLLKRDQVSSLGETIISGYKIKEL